MIGMTFFLLVLLIIAGFLASLYNRIVFLKNNFMRAWANIDVLLKQRHDEIPKLVSTCEGYMKFEKKVLENVTALRSQAMGAKNVGEKLQAEQLLTQAISGLFAVIENYPDLKSNEQFSNLQKRISYLENQISDRREFYNDSAAIYNTLIEQIPYNFIATYFNFSRQELFMASIEDKKDIAIKFDVPK